MKRNFEISHEVLYLIEDTKYPEFNQHSIFINSKEKDYHFEIVYQKDGDSYLVLGEMSIDITSKIIYLMRDKDNNINEGIRSTANYLYYKEILRKLEK